MTGENRVITCVDGQACKCSLSRSFQFGQLTATTLPIMKGSLMFDSHIVTTIPDEQSLGFIISFVFVAIFDSI